MTFTWNTDTVYTYTGDTLDYYVTSGEIMVYEGRAVKSPSKSGIEINLRKIAEDWLEMEFRDFLEMNGALYHHEDAFRSFTLYRSSDGTVLYEFNCVINDLGVPVSGISNDPVDGKADCRQKLFVTYFGNWTGDTTEDIDIHGEDIYYFNAQSAVTVPWNAGYVEVPVSTNYNPWEIELVLNGDIAPVTRSYSRFSFTVPINFLNATMPYVVEYWRNGRKLDETTVTVGACTAYFTCQNSVTVGGDGTYFDITFDTDIPLEFIGVEPGSGISFIRLEPGKARLYADPNTSINPFYTGVRFINTATGDQIGYTYVTVSAPTVYFFVDPVYYLDCDGGTLTIPVTTSYDMSRVTVQTPGAVTVLSKTQTGITVSVDANTSTTDVAVHDIVFSYGAVIGTTRIEVDVFTYHFSTIDSIGYNPYDDENVFIPWTTNIPIDAIAITLPPGSTLVSRDASGITITHPSADGNVTFSFNGGTLAVVPVYSLAESYLTCVATTRGHLPWRGLQVRINGGQWFEINTGTSLTTLTILEVGDKAELRGTNWERFGAYDGCCYFTAYGNLMSICNGDSYRTSSFIGKKPGNFFQQSFITDASGVILPAFSDTNSLNSLFKGCSALTKPPVFPHIVNLAESAYQSMFEDCISLEYIPAVNVDNIGDYACYSMFNDCWSATTIGSFNAVSVGSHGCERMYNGCSGVTVGPEISTTTLGDHAFDSMFWDCSGLTTVTSTLPALSVPDSAYECMFQNCTSLGTAPEIKAVTAGDSSMEGMFYGCTHLTNVPDLVATTLGVSSMRQMFSHCTSLVNAPELPATVGVAGCYSEMFDYCTSLRYIKCLLADTGSGYYEFTYAWVRDVPINIGTFVKQTGVYFSAGVNGIPANWTVQEV